MVSFLPGESMFWPICLQTSRPDICVLQGYGRKVSAICNSHAESWFDGIVLLKFNMWQVSCLLHQFASWQTVTIRMQKSGSHDPPAPVEPLRDAAEAEARAGEPMTLLKCVLETTGFFQSSLDFCRWHGILLPQWSVTVFCFSFSTPPPRVSLCCPGQSF